MNLPMESELLNYNVPEVCRALTDARGDMIVAARLLRVKVRDVRDAIQMIPEVQGHFMAVQKAVAEHPDVERATSQQLDRRIRHLTTVYAADGLEALHELATQPFIQDSYMMDIKFKAASKLVQAKPVDGRNDDIGQLMVALNEQYQKSSGRITHLSMQLERMQGGGESLHIEATSESPPATHEITLVPLDAVPESGCTPEPLPEPDDSAVARSNTPIPYAADHAADRATPDSLDPEP